MENDFINFYDKYDNIVSSASCIRTLIGKEYLNGKILNINSNEIIDPGNCNFMFGNKSKYNTTEATCGNFCLLDINFNIIVPHTIDFINNKFILGNILGYKSKNKIYESNSSMGEFIKNKFDGYSYDILDIMKGDIIFEKDEFDILFGKLDNILIFNVDLTEYIRICHDDVDG